MELGLIFEYESVMEQSYHFFPKIYSFSPKSCPSTRRDCYTVPRDSLHDTRSAAYSRHQAAVQKGYSLCRTHNHFTEKPNVRFSFHKTSLGRAMARPKLFLADGRRESYSLGANLSANIGI